MTSTFGWLDTDGAQNKKMLEVIDLFKEEGTVDELGIGSIRDALSDALFPGTSVLHTRLRYVLFIPWLLQQSSQRGTPTEMREHFRSQEYRLIASLIAGNEIAGVIGNRARGTLKTLPSSMYWAALGSWGIRQGDFSIDGFFRRQYDHRALARRSPRFDDLEASEALPSKGLDPHLPTPPATWMKAVDFKLLPQEEQYLSDVISAAHPGSMLAGLSDGHRSATAG